MAQTISLWGATYSNVPAILLPKQGGGTARFSDASVTTAVASDVASGKQFLLADGSVGTGTASGGGGGGFVDNVTTLVGGGDYHAITGTQISGTLNISADGTYDVTQYESVEVSVGGGGGGLSLGSFTINATYDVGSRNGLVFVSTLTVTNSPNVAFPVRVGQTSDSYSWIVAEDGYMHVTFLGSSDSYTPSVTATSGTATLEYTGSSSTAMNGKQPYVCWVVYKISPGAVVTLSSYNNN